MYYIFILTLLLSMLVLNTSINKTYAVASMKVIIDTDGGPDDALAILLALQYEASCTKNEFQILAITCTYGNTYIKNVEENVLKTLTMANRSDIPVYSGAQKPLLYNYSPSNYFGKDGLGDFNFSKEIIAKVDETKHASIALIDLVEKYSGEVNLLCLGPLTNIAIAIALKPSFLQSIKEIIIMGSSVLGMGNVEPNIEFNFGFDPESNFMVLNTSTKIPSILFPWETSYESATSMTWRKDVFGKLNSPLVNFLNKAERLQLNDTKWIAADGLATAIMIWPDMIKKSVLTNVSPVTKGEAKGSVLVDYINCTDKIKNAKIVQQVNVTMFKENLLRYFSNETKYTL